MIAVKVSKIHKLEVKLRIARKKHWHWQCNGNWQCRKRRERMNDRRRRWGCFVTYAKGHLFNPRAAMWGGLAVSDARKYSDFKVPCRYFKMLIKDWTYDNSTVNIETFIYIFLFYTNKIIKYLPTCLGGNKYIIMYYLYLLDSAHLKVTNQAPFL